jgi:hypothetical protein
MIVMALVDSGFWSEAFCACLPSGLDEVCREWDLVCDFFWAEVLCARLVIAMASVDSAFGGIEQHLGKLFMPFCG